MTKKEYNKEYYKKHKEYMKEYNKEYYKEHKDYYKEYHKEYSKEHKDEIKELARKYRTEHKDEIKEHNKKYKRIYQTEHKDEIKEHNKKYLGAHNILNNAILKGEIIRGPCSVCGSTKRIHGHHEDYNKPLEVIWVCAIHHKEIHNKQEIVK